jgi:hypothetical protein
MAETQQKIQDVSGEKSILHGKVIVKKGKAIPVTSREGP